MRDTVRNSITSALTDLVTDGDERALLLRVLSQAGMPLHHTAKYRFGILCLACYDAAAEIDQKAVQGAAAVELFAAAGCVFDDVIDEPRRPDTPVNTAAGLSLIVLAHLILQQVTVRSLPPAEASALLAQADSALLLSIAGEYRGLLSMDSSSLSSEDAFQITSLKAGSFGRLAAVVGAGLAQVPEEARRLLLDCCQSYATYLQLIDDVADAVEQPRSTGPSDASQGKLTLPLVYLLNAREGSDRLRASTNDSHPNPEHIMSNRLRSPEPTAAELRETGAVLFTELTAEMLHNKALGAAARVAELTGKASMLLAALHSTPNESGNGPPATNNVNHDPSEGTSL